GEDVIFAIQRLPAQRGARERAQLAMPIGLAVFVCLRRWAGSLVLAAARVSRDSSGSIHDGDAASGVLRREILCAEVHGVLRPASGNAGQLARQADVKAEADVPSAGSRDATTGADWRAGPKQFLPPPTSFATPV